MIDEMSITTTPAPSQYSWSTRAKADLFLALVDFALIPLVIIFPGHGGQRILSVGKFDIGIALALLFAVSGVLRLIRVFFDGTWGGSSQGFIDFGNIATLVLMIVVMDMYAYRLDAIYTVASIAVALVLITLAVRMRYSWWWLLLAIALMVSTATMFFVGPMPPLAAIVTNIVVALILLFMAFKFAEGKPMLAHTSMEMAKYALVVGYFVMFSHEDTQYEMLVNSPVSLSTFVDELTSRLKYDTKTLSFIKGGLKDGDIEDDDVEVESKFVPLVSLKPTQSEIDMDKSVGYYLERPSASTNMLETIEKSLNPIQPMDIVIPPSPITAVQVEDTNGLIQHYILDGHHRWSQQYIFAGTNQKRLQAEVLESVGGREKALFKDPIRVLKLAHLAIASVDEAVPVKDANAEFNVFAMDEAALRKYFTELPGRLGATVTTNYGEIEALLVSKGMTGVSAIDFLVDRSLAIKQAPPSNFSPPRRRAMPQFDELSPADKKLDNLTFGSVNFKSPYKLVQN